MKRLVLLCVAVLVAIPVLAAAQPAGAAKYDNCDLLTKKQVSKILGYKVVATKLEREKSTGAEQCEWRTAKYWGQKLKEYHAPYKLGVTTQPLTDDVERSIENLEVTNRTEKVPELGDRVMLDQFHKLLAVVGPVVLQIEVRNWSSDGGADIQTDVVDPEIAAAKLLIPLFENASDQG